MKTEQDTQYSNQFNINQKQPKPMAFLFIEQPVEELIKEMRWSLKVWKESSLPEAPQKVETLEDKIRCAEMYKEMFEKRDEYDKFKHLRFKNPNAYLQRCREYIQNIKGIDVTKDFKFRVRVRMNGKTRQLGAFETPKDALEVLGSFTKSSS